MDRLSLLMVVPMPMVMGMTTVIVLHLHITTHEFILLAVNGHNIHSTPSGLMVRLFLHLVCRLTLAFRLTGHPTDTNLGLPCPPSPKKAHPKWQKAHGRCQEHHSQAPHWELGRIRLHHCRANWGITRPLGAVLVIIRLRKDLDNWDRRRMPSPNKHKSSRRRDRHRCNSKERARVIGNNQGCVFFLYHFDSFLSYVLLSPCVCTAL